MSRRRPYRLIVGHEEDVMHEPDFGSSVRMLVDVLECGHKHPARFLQPASKTPYTHEMGADGKPVRSYRRCNSCPLEEV